MTVSQLIAHGEPMNTQMLCARSPMMMEILLVGVGVAVLALFVFFLLLALGEDPWQPALRVRPRDEGVQLRSAHHWWTRRRCQTQEPPV